MSEPQTLPGVVEVFCDADHAAEMGTRKSRSGVAVSKALISGESEYYALLRSLAHAFGIKALLSDWCCGVNCEVPMHCDSSAARGLSARQGLGKTVTSTCVSCGYNRQCKKVVSGRRARTCQTHSRNPCPQADADRCHRCMGFHVGNVGSGRHLKMEST